MDIVPAATASVFLTTSASNMKMALSIVSVNQASPENAVSITDLVKYTTYAKMGVNASICKFLTEASRQRCMSANVLQLTLGIIVKTKTLAYLYHVKMEEHVKHWSLIINVSVRKNIMERVVKKTTAIPHLVYMEELAQE